MRKHNFIGLALSVVVGLLWVIAGCIVISPGCRPCVILLGKHERTEQLSAPFVGGGTLHAKTHNGAIRVRGKQTQRCEVTANIRVRTDTDETARKLAEEIKLRLTSSGNTLTVKVDKPPVSGAHNIRVDLDIVLPKQSNLRLTSHNGPMTISDISGNTNAETHNGSLKAEKISGDLQIVTHNGRAEISDISGNVKAKTYNGSLTAERISGDLQATSHNGQVKASYAQEAQGARNIEITTHNAGISLQPPKGFSASVEIESHNGSIHTDLPLTVVGKIGHRRLKGTIGDGQGRLRLKSHNGSVRIESPAPQ